MTSRPTAAREPGAPDIIRFPDPPPADMSTFKYLTFPGFPAALSVHFGSPETTIVTSEVAAGLRPTASDEGVLFPDLLIAFGVDSAARLARNGYLIPEQGKPPDFVLEIASETTGRRDETIKRDAYAGMWVPEYWRFDHTGGRFHRSPLSGDRLVSGSYQPIEINRSGDRLLWGHSQVLNLDLCWEEGRLRFWDPAAQRYLSTYQEVHDSHRAERSARLEAESQRERERSARLGAEERVRQLEEELRRRNDS